MVANTLQGVLTQEDAVNQAISASQPVLNLEQQLKSGAPVTAQVGIEGSPYVPRGTWEKGDPQHVWEKGDPQPTVQQPTPVPRGTLNPVPQQQQARVTPCDFGYCDANAGSYVNGRNVMQENLNLGYMGLPNGGGRLGQRLTEGYLKSLGATIGNVEQTNVEQEKANIEALRRSPQWYANYNEASSAYPNQPELAGRQADLMTANTQGGQIASEVNRYVGQDAQNKINTYANQQGARSLVIDGYAEANPIPTASNGVNPEVSIAGVKQNPDGTNNVNYNIAGKQYEIANQPPEQTLPNTISVGANTNYDVLAGQVATVNKNATDRAKAQTDLLKVQTSYENQQEQNRIRQEQLEINRLKARNDGLKNTLANAGYKTEKEIAQIFDIPDKFTESGRSKWLNALTAQRKAEDKLAGKSDGGSGFGSAEPQVGFAPTGKNNLTSDYIRNNHPALYSAVTRYNNALDLIQDRDTWGSSQRATQVLNELQGTYNQMLPITQAWLNSDTPTSKQTGVEMQRNLRYVQDAIAELNKKLRALDAIEQYDYEQQLYQQEQQYINNGRVGGM